MRISDIDPTLKVWIENQGTPPYNGENVMEGAVAAEVKPQTGKGRGSSVRVDRLRTKDRAGAVEKVVRPDVLAQIDHILNDIPTGNTRVIPAGMTDEEFIAFIRS